MRERVEGKGNFLLLEGMKVEERYGVAVSYNKGNNGFQEGWMGVNLLSRSR
jgi:hypothetical protein